MPTWQLFQEVSTTSSHTSSVLVAFLGVDETTTRWVCHVLSEGSVLIHCHFILYYILYFLCGAKIRWIVEKAPGKNKEWQLLGKHASPKCLAALCGINSRRLVRAAHGLLDHRFACNGAVSKLQVENLFFHLAPFDPISYSLGYTSHDGPRLEQKWPQSAGRWICICLAYTMVPQECFQTSYFEKFGKCSID